MKILIVADFVPFPTIGGDRLRLASLLNWFVESGHEVFYLLLQTQCISRKERRELEKRCHKVYHVELRSWSRRFRQSVGGLIRSLLNRSSWGRSVLRHLAFIKQKSKRCQSSIPVDVLSLDRDFNKVLDVVRSMSEKPEVVLCEYAATTRCFEIPEFHDALKIVDTYDVLHERNAMIEKGLHPWRTCPPEEERRYLKKSDIIIAIQEEEAATFRSFVPERTVICVGQPFLAHRTVQKKLTLSCLFIGTTHAANLEGLHWFQKEVWPRVLAKVRSTELLIVGPMADYASCAQSTYLLGVLEDLESVYQSAAVVAVPIFSGTGLKIKLVEALSRGKAVVTTKHAARGIQEKDVFLLAQDPVLFAQHVISLLTNNRLRQHFENLAFRFTEKYLSRDQVYAPLKVLLDR